jgi:hypothetical protein
MKLKLYKKILICSILVLIFNPVIVNGENIETGSIKIDSHWFYIFQLDDLITFEVNEYLYINNTGTTAFNDSFFIWIQNNSIISSECCNYTSNMACRYNATLEKECFFLTKHNDTNLHIGNPITSKNRLSYYGQKEKISITYFSITNPYLENTTLKLNATIGGKSIPRNEDNFQDTGIHISSKNKDIGLQPVIDTYIPYRIMTIENLTFFNNGTEIEVIGFAINDLPQGWTAEIWNETVELDNITLSPQEFKSLNLVITAPSYLASIYVRYTTQINIDGNERKEFFIKKYLYDIKLVSYEVYLTSNYELKVSNDLKMVHDKLFWLEDYERYWFLTRGDDIESNSYTTMSIKYEKTDDSQINPFYIILLVSIIILIISILLMKKFGFFKEDELEQKNKDYSAKKIKELEEQKEKILSSIKRVEQEYNENIISKVDYEQLRGAYKKRAVNILKEIDKLKEKQF